MNTSGYRKPPPPAFRPREPPFPLGVLRWKRYTCARALAAAILAASLFRLVLTVPTTAAQRASALKAARAEMDSRGAIRKCWDGAVWLFWDRTPEPERVRVRAEAILRGRRRDALAGAVLAWILAWLVFDWDRARHIVFAALSIGAGVLYALLPVDLIPDFIPVAGAVDDIAAGALGTGLGAASLAEYWRARRRRDRAAGLLAIAPDAALDFLLEECGLERSEPAWTPAGGPSDGRAGSLAADAAPVITSPKTMENLR